MKVIQKYQAFDGSEFNSQSEAEKYEALADRCHALEQMLGKHPDDSGERVKHPRLEEYRLAVVELCREMFPRESVFQHPAADIHPFSYAGRFLDECAPKPVRGLWWRLSCVGADGYEYQQPFFALNPDKFIEQLSIG